ncbi:MAG: M23 family metallopeptidase [Endozoicomonadaceae bacterium]|nr:M23 family metallopeptidase [Endozoicomonadaceae bacterium]
MKIIVVSQQHDRGQVINLRLRSVVALACLVAGVLLASGCLLAWSMMSVNATGSLSAREILRWENTISHQQDEIVRVRESASVEVNALALHLVQIQERVLRLDALGEHLTVMTNLDAGEFDFSRPVAQGEHDSMMKSSISYQSPEFLSLIDQLAMQIDQSEEQLNVLESLLLDRKLHENVSIAGRPIKKGWMSSPFGRRTDPFSGRPDWHKGIDFAGKEGSDIVAVGSGVVIWAGERSGYGNLVEVNHGNGYVTRYGHNKDVLVNVGDIISKGEVISLMGSTGRSTGPHVHFEVLVDGRQVNPARYIYRASR